MDGLAFTTEDKEKAIALGTFIHTYAKWDITTAQSFELNRHLSWLASTVKKIEANILEVTKVTPAPVPTKKGK